MNTKKLLQLRLIRKALDRGLEKQAFLGAAGSVLKGVGGAALNGLFVGQSLGGLVDAANGDKDAQDTYMTQIPWIAQGMTGLVPSLQSTAIGTVGKLAWPMFAAEQLANLGQSHVNWADQSGANGGRANSLVDGTEYRKYGGMFDAQAWKDYFYYGWGSGNEKRDKGLYSNFNQKINAGVKANRPALPQNNIAAKTPTTSTAPKPATAPAATPKPAASSSTGGTSV